MKIKIIDFFKLVGFKYLFFIFAAILAFLSLIFYNTNLRHFFSFCLVAILLINAHFGIEYIQSFCFKILSKFYIKKKITYFVYNIIHKLELFFYDLFVKQPKTRLNYIFCIINIYIILGLMFIFYNSFKMTIIVLVCIILNIVSQIFNFSQIKFVVFNLIVGTILLV